MPDAEAETYRIWIERGALAIEIIAVALIVGFILVATLAWLIRSVRTRELAVANYERFRLLLGRALLLGLEILVAADIVRTVALDSTLRSIAELGLLVLIRTFLSWSIVLEVEGRWPWQRRPVPDRSRP